MALSAPRGSIGKLFKQACNEIPEIVGATGIGLTGLVLGCIGIYDYNKNDGENRKYKYSYVIMRPDDPRVAKIHKD